MRFGKDGWFAWLGQKVLFFEHDRNLDCDLRKVQLKYYSREHKNLKPKVLRKKI